MLGPAGMMEKIISGNEYPVDLNSLYSTIFTIHCVKTNECPVIIETLGGTTTEFPPGSFVQGAAYHIYIKKMEFDESKAGFIGYRLLLNKVK